MACLDFNCLLLDKRAPLDCRQSRAMRLQLSSRLCHPNQQSGAAREADMGCGRRWPNRPEVPLRCLMSHKSSRLQGRTSGQTFAFCILIVRLGPSPKACSCPCGERFQVASAIWARKLVCKYRLEVISLQGKQAVSLGLQRGATFAQIIKVWPFVSKLAADRVASCILRVFLSLTRIQLLGII